MQLKSDELDGLALYCKPWARGAHSNNATPAASLTQLTPTFALTSALLTGFADLIRPWYPYKDHLPPLMLKVDVDPSNAIEEVAVAQEVARVKDVKFVDASL